MNCVKIPRLYKLIQTRDYIMLSHSNLKSVYTEFTHKNENISSWKGPDGWFLYFS